MAERDVKLGSLAPGVNNRLEPTQLATKLPDGTKATYLYGADNVDINELGYLKRRRGKTVLVAGETHSLWADDAGAYVVHEATLKRVVPAGASVALETVRAGMPKLPVSYSRGADGDVYWSNGATIRRIAGGADRPITAVAPNPVPSITVVAGALRAGSYLLAFTSLTVDGESPATPVVRIEVPDGSGFGIAATAPVEIYMSAPDGDVLTLQASAVTAGSIVTHVETGRRCATLNRALMPPGTIVRHYRGRMLVAAGQVLYVSDPYYYGVLDPSSGYIPFPEAITVVEPTDNGLYICADKTYWISDLFNGDLQELLPYGAIPGTSGRSPNDEQVFWQSPNGLVVADKNASIKAVQENALQFSAAASGASLYRESDGMTHIVSSRSRPQPNTAVASSWMEARVIQKGTTL